MGQRSGAVPDAQAYKSRFILDQSAIYKRGCSILPECCVITQARWSLKLKSRLEDQ